MKARTSFLKRCLALALALVLLASGTNMGIVLQAFAAGSEITVKISQIVADNYDLTAQEKDLLVSGNLAGGTYSYTEPDSGLVTVDTDNQKITAAVHEDWVPAKAYIMVGEEEVETVELTDGEGSYAYDGNAFSVKVDYTLDIQVDADAQETLLNTAGWLKAGVANINALVDANNANLGALEMAMSELVNLADNGYEVFGRKVDIDQPTKDAIYALNSQIAANGNLNLVVMSNAYGAGKTEYMLKNGQAMKTELSSTRANVAQVHTCLGDIKNASEMFGEGSFDSSTINLVKTLHAMLGNWVAAADTAIAGSWTASEKGTALVSDTVNYAALDALVAALGATSAPAVKDTLHVADTAVQVNLNMYNVTVDVALVLVEDKADSNELVEHAKSEPVVLTLSAGATMEEIKAAVAAANIEAAAQANWAGIYEAAHFETGDSGLPETLTGDIEYTINYTPKKYTITLGYADAMTVYYGYQYTLPRHSDAAQAYDYYVGSQKMAQGAVYTVKGDVEITRNVGKAYTSTDLYTVIADNYGNAVATAMLKSGALKNNEIINVRKPDPADAESLIKLEDGKLVIIDNKYAADYEGLNWVPFSYGASGDEKNFGFEPTEVAWADASVKVKYSLILSNYSEAEVEEIQKAIVALKEEAAEQKKTLDRLAGYHSQMKQLDKTKLGALNGVIGVTDLNADPAKNEALKAEFTKMVNGIINNNLDGNELRICSMLGSYLEGGLSYYYNNSAAVIKEINTLSGYLSGLLDSEDKVAALEILVTAADFPEYADKIKDLERVMAEVQAALTAPNAMIDLNSENLYKLIEALESEEEAGFNNVGHPFLISETLSAIDDSTVQVQVFVEIKGKSETFTTEAQPRGHVLTQAEVNVLTDSIEAYAEQQLGEKVGFYQVTGFEELNALVGNALDQKQTNVYMSYTPREYTITVEGVGDKSVTVESAQIELPGHGTKGWIYTYDVFGTETVVAFGETKTHTVTLADFAKIADGQRTITRTEENKAQDDLEDAVDKMDTIELVKDADENIIGVIATVDASKDSLMDFAQELTELGYSYIELNDGVLLDTGVVSLQVLMDGILADNSFGSQTLIDLNENNGGAVFSGILDLGNAANDIMFEGVDFTFKLKSAPSQLATVADGLKKVKDYMTFNSQDGVMSINLNLPEKVYEVYLTALLGTGEVDKTDMNAVNAEIAYIFLWDYIDLIINTDANTTTYTNTLAKLGKDYDLTGTEKYYQLVKKTLTNDGVKVNQTENDGIFDVNVTAAGKSAIDGLMGLVGMDPSSFTTYLGMVKEYQDGENLTVTAVATLGNVPTKYEALILDLGADGVVNKFDYTADLPARVKTVANQAAVILLGDVDGNLNFPGTTILDLNGYTVNGGVSSKGDLFIVDSRLETNTAGCVTGTVKATAIFGGKYSDTAGAEAALKNGYKLVDGVVENALFNVVLDGNTYTYYVNTDVMADESIGSYTTFAKALAVEIAADMALNYFTAAAMSVDGNTIYAIDYTELLALLKSDSKVDTLINETLECVDAAGITAVANTILDDLVDFAAIETALNKGTAVATYGLSVAPWKVDVKHVQSEDYIDFGVASNPDLAKSYNIAIAFTGEKYIDNVARLVGELKNIAAVDVNVKLEQPTYANKKFTVAGSADAYAAFDLSQNPDYATVVGVVLAYGNTAKRAAVAEAINNNDMDALKDVVDNTTVAEVFTAMKKLSRNVDFAAMAEAVGVTIDAASAADLESIYHLVLCAGGKVLEELEITGTNSKLGALYNAETGYYELTKADITRDGDVTVRGYTAYGEVELTSLTLKVKLFPECMWGDADDDGDVDGEDIIMYRWMALIDENPDLDIVPPISLDDFCMIRTDFNNNGVIDGEDIIHVRWLALMYENPDLDIVPPIDLDRFYVEVK